MKKKLIEIWLEDHEGDDNEDITFVNVVDDDDDCFEKASDILKQFAYVFFKLNEDDVEGTEVTNSDRKRKTRTRTKNEGTSSK